VRARARNWSRRVDRRVDRIFTQAEPAVVRWAHAGRQAWGRWSKRLLRWGRPVYVRLGRLVRWLGRRLRPLGVLGLRLLSAAERGTRRAIAWSTRASTAAAGVLTPARALACVAIASSACLLASQFVDYRGVEVGQPGYAGLGSIATAPVVGLESPTDAHSYALVPVALAGIVLGLLALTRGRRRVGRIVVALGALALAVVLIVDLPAGLDLSGQASRFAGATAVLTDGFYAQLASAAGMMLSGLLLTFGPTSRAARTRRGVPAINDGKARRGRPRKPSLARTQGGVARERTTGA
jgi:hypothetical protein